MVLVTGEILYRLNWEHHTGQGASEFNGLYHHWGLKGWSAGHVNNLEQWELDRCQLKHTYSVAQSVQIEKYQIIYTEASPTKDICKTYWNNETNSTSLWMSNMFFTPPPSAIVRIWNNPSPTLYRRPLWTTPNVKTLVHATNNNILMQFNAIIIQNSQTLSSSFSHIGIKRTH